MKIAPIERRAAVAALVGGGVSQHPVRHALAASGVEEIRKAASLLPGYGPPDIIYPAPFIGRWRVSRTVADVQAPLGDSAAPAEQLSFARGRLALGRPDVYEARFLGITDSDGAIADRAFNAERRQAALSDSPSSRIEARWEPSNPNVLTLARGGGSIVEIKVTKRSYESPRPNAFGTSEYARIADAGSEGVLGGVPLIRASRVQARYRWDDNGGDGAVTPPSSVKQIEALELEQVFDPSATGFTDLAGASPVLTVKARLTYSRIS